MNKFIMNGYHKQVLVRNIQDLAVLLAVFFENRAFHRKVGGWQNMGNFHLNKYKFSMKQQAGHMLLLEFVICWLSNLFSGLDLKIGRGILTPNSCLQLILQRKTVIQDLCVSLMKKQIDSVPVWAYLYYQNLSIGCLCLIKASLSATTSDSILLFRLIINSIAYTSLGLSVNGLYL